MPSFLVSPNMSPVMKYTVTKVKGTFHRFVLSFGGIKQIVFGQIVESDGNNINVEIFNSPTGNPVQLNRRFIVSVEAGFSIYTETTIHQNESVARSYASDHVPQVGGHKRVHYGAVPEDVTIKGLFPDRGGEEFYKVVEKIKHRILIGHTS